MSLNGTLGVGVARTFCTKVHSIGKVLRSKGFLCRTMSGQVVPLVVP